MSSIELRKEGSKFSGESSIIELPLSSAVLSMFASLLAAFASVVLLS
ncbi:MAG: hypothetical protein P0116_10345 [Candidatus Nitrosocosmicus sp.]|nr:hypothetical protein [Candidatus Nitrosocosmicus sp.]